MEEKNGFTEVLEKIGRKAVRLDKQIQDIRYCCQAGEPEAAYERALRLEENVEKLVLLARVLPAYTGSPVAAEEVGRIMKECIPVEVGFTKEGWFSLRMPSLLPKKEKGSVDYIRDFLYPVMREFFRGKQTVRYRDCVVIYRHVYDRNRPERKRRDHDNIETNMVTDIVALYVLPDDSPDFCTHYECSAAGGEERTEVYIVPKTDFTTWFEMEKEMPEDGIRLYDTLSQKAEKDM